MVGGFGLVWLDDARNFLIVCRSILVIVYRSPLPKVTLVEGSRPSALGPWWLGLIHKKPQA